MSRLVRSAGATARASSRCCGVFVKKTSHYQKDVERMIRSCRLLPLTARAAQPRSATGDGGRFVWRPRLCGADSVGQGHSVRAQHLQSPRTKLVHESRALEPQDYPGAMAARASPAVGRSGLPLRRATSAALTHTRASSSSGCTCRSWTCRPSLPAAPSPQWRPTGGDGAVALVSGWHSDCRARRAVLWLRALAGCSSQVGDASLRFWHTTAAAAAV